MNNKLSYIKNNQNVGCNAECILDRHAMLATDNLGVQEIGGGAFVHIPPFVTNFKLYFLPWTELRVHLRIHHSKHRPDGTQMSNAEASNVEKV